MDSLCPRVKEVLGGPHVDIRMVGLAQKLEMELSVQTDLAVHWKEQALKYREMLKDKIAVDESPD